MQLLSYDVLGGYYDILGCCQGVAMQLLCYSRCSLGYFKVVAMELLCIYDGVLGCL